MSTGVRINVSREPYKQHDRIIVDIQHLKFGLHYIVYIDPKNCDVQVMPDKEPSLIPPNQTRLERSHRQHALASALFTMHHWSQHFHIQYQRLMAYMNEGVCDGYNPFEVTGPDDITDPEESSFIAATWVGINPALTARIGETKLTFLDRMQLYARHFDLADHAEKLHKNYRISKPRHRLIETYCEALKLSPLQLASWLKEKETLEELKEK